MSRALVTYTDGQKAVTAQEGFLSREKLREEFGSGVVITQKIMKDKIKGLSPIRKKTLKPHKWIKIKSRKINLH
jgi:hypothetical protein